MRFEVRVGGLRAVAVAGLVLGSFTEAVGQDRLSRSIDGPVTPERVARALVPVPDPDPGTDPAGVTEIGLSLRVQFDLDSAVLTPVARRDLDQVAIAFNRPELAASALTLEGHTDSSGEAGYNLRLSQLRADAVVAYLVSRGVAPDRLRAIGYGESRPLDSLRPADPRQRRVEIVRRF